MTDTGLGVGSGEDTHERLTVMIGGDVFPDLPAGPDPFIHLGPLLESADVVAANCEGVYCDDPWPSPSHKHFMVAPASSAAPLRGTHFQVLGCANNHALDGGYAGLRSTRAVLESKGIGVVGAGENIAEATLPLVVERRSVKVAFVAFCSVYPVGYEARENRPGIAPLRVRTFYSNPDPNFWEPGIAPVVTTTCDEADWDRCRRAIAAGSAQADAVVVLAHWGHSSVVETILPYEMDLARRMVDAGADAVVCCHHHSLRGIDVHRGKPIFHGVGALVHHLRVDRAGTEDFPLFPFHPDARMSGLALVEIGSSGVAKVGFVPALIQPDGSTRPLRASDPEQAAVFAYLSRLNVESGFTTKFDATAWRGWAFLDVGL